jgi:riboflavin kinase/FMN adenylyltransferase
MCMRVLDWDQFTAGTLDAKSAMTIGVFDGVHLGHQALLGRIVRGDLMPVIISFRRNPKQSRRDWEGDIYTLDQKLDIFRRLGAALTVLIDFSGDFSKLRGKDFFDLLKSRGRLSYLAVGGDFRCGYRLDTDAAAVKKMNEADNIPTDVIPPVVRGSSPVSSSRIRAAITRGDLAEAAALLGRNVEIDLSGFPRFPAAGGVFFKALPGRVLPPGGRYKVRVGGETTEAVLDGGRIFVPSPFIPGGLEFPAAD